MRLTCEVCGHINDMCAKGGDHTVVTPPKAQLPGWMTGAYPESSPYSSPFADAQDGYGQSMYGQGMGYVGQGYENAFQKAFNQGPFSPGPGMTATEIEMKMRAQQEMLRRYEALQQRSMRDISDYQNLPERVINNYGNYVRVNGQWVTRKAFEDGEFENESEETKKLRMLQNAVLDELTMEQCAVLMQEAAPDSIAQRFDGLIFDEEKKT